MSLYGDKKDYEELVKDNIQKAKILVSIPEKNRPLVLELLKKREEIIKKNGLFVNLELKKIDKKILKNISFLQVLEILNRFAKKIKYRLRI